MQCSFCHLDDDLPFTCSYCKLILCSQHRLPEKHECNQLYRVHKPRDTRYDIPVNNLPLRNVSNIDYKINQILTNEFRHLLLGMILVLLVGISFFLGNFGSSYPVWSIIVISVILMSSFLIHEMSHKFLALNNGYKAEFRVNSFGLLLTFFSIFPIPLKIIAPGAVIISGYPSKSKLGMIALAGPFSNIVLGLLSLFILNVFSLSLEWYSIFLTSAYINGIIASFNLLPFSIIDGKKVYNWNKLIWFTSFMICTSFIFVVSYIM